jgi:hypothetical protein
MAGKGKANGTILGVISSDRQRHDWHKARKRREAQDLPKKKEE